MTYEYETMKIGPGDLDDAAQALNERGRRGFRIVSVTRAGNGALEIIFEKANPPSPV